MCQLQYQAINDEEIRINLIRANGYCNFHFYEMARLTSPAAISRVVRELVQKEIERFQDNLFPGPRIIDCPVCKYLKEREDFFLEEIVTLLWEEEFRKKYEGTDGLCNLHLQRILSLPNIDSLGIFLTEAQLRQFQRIKMQLDDELGISEMVPSNRKRESISWVSGMRKIAGKKGLRDRCS